MPQTYRMNHFYVLIKTPPRLGLNSHQNILLFRPKTGKIQKVRYKSVITKNLLQEKFQKSILNTVDVLRSVSNLQDQ